MKKRMETNFPPKLVVHPRYEGDMTGLWLAVALAVFALAATFREVYLVTKPPAKQETASAR